MAARAEPEQADVRAQPAVPSSGAPAMTVQRRLSVGAADDPYEREADRVADAVVRRLASGVELAATPRISRRATDADAAPVGREGGSVRPETEQRISAMRGSGSPLQDGVRRSMEDAMGTDFSGVRTHAGPAARDLNDELGAKAFTVGSDVFFRDGPSAANDTHLLAHELAHVVQQDASVRRAPGDAVAAARAKGVAPEAQLAVCAAQVGMMRNHLQSALGMLAPLMGLTAAATVDPGAAGAVFGMAKSASGMLDGAKNAHRGAAQSWAACKSFFSDLPIAPLAAQFDKNLADIGAQIGTWIAMAGSIGPGSMATVAILSGKIGNGIGVVGGLAGAVLSPGALAAPQSSGGAPNTPASPAQNTGGGYDQYTSPLQNTGGGYDQYTSPLQNTGGGYDQYTSPAQNTGGGYDQYTSPAQNTGGGYDQYTSPLRDDGGGSGAYSQPSGGGAPTGFYSVPDQGGGGGGTNEYVTQLSGGGSQYGVYSSVEQQDSGTYSVVSNDQFDVDDVFDDDDEFDDLIADVPAPKYSKTKQMDGRYSAESISGSPDLPLIIEAGNRLVQQGKFPSIHQFMISQFGWTAEDVDKYVINGEASKVKYLDADERKAYELRGGSTLKQGDAEEPFDTGGMFSKHSGAGFGIYVMAPDGTIYADQHKVSLFHHSSFLSGGDVAAAGEIKVVSGAVKVVTNKTGHYGAGDPELWQMLDELKSRGINLSGIEVRNNFRSTAPWPGGDAQRFWETMKP